MKQTTGNLVYTLYGSTENNFPSVEILTSSNTDTRGTSQLSTTSWTHLAATYDGSTLKLYIIWCASEQQTKNRKYAKYNRPSKDWWK